MKFVCDKCKTRYSIGEDRVRGKILKIRCKNCANVITVREGLDADGGHASGRPRTTTGAPPTGSISTAKAASPPPPPALEQEWYVSIDGVQSGPHSLAEAQKWVTSKPFEADLHCWSEGFDDWLSVDKVAHFRNLRKPKPPAPSARPKTIPPPTPAKPLFAATMAAIEKDATSSQPMRAVAVPAARANGSGSGPTPQTARGNGSGPAPSAPAIPTRTASPSGRFNAAKSSSQAALAAAFDSEDAGADSRTQLEAPAFKGNAFDLGGRSDASVKLPEPKPSNPFATFESKPSVPPLMDDDDLSIGEVSRVVKLTDILPRPKPKPLPSAGNASTMPRVGAGPKFSPTDLGMNVDPAFAPQGGPAADESMVAQSFAHRHRRGMLALLAFAVLLVAGVIGVLMYVTSQQNDEVGGGFGGGTRTIDTSRPEDIVRRQLPPTPTDTGSNAVTQVRPKWTGRPNGTPTPVEDDPKGLSLKASEIEDMAAKQGEGTKRCYMRAQKGALGFEIAELKKIAVTLTVGKDGVVNTVGLSSHEADMFGTCLIARIKAWRFRESPNGGTFRISLAFSS